MKEGSKEYKNLVMRIRKFCMGYGRLGHLKATWTDRRKVPFKVKFYYGENNGFFLPYLVSTLSWSDINTRSIYR